MIRPNTSNPLTDEATRAKGPRGALLRSGTLVFVATLLWSICGFIYSAIAGRILTVSDYGTLYALISLYAVVIVPAGVLAPVVAKYAAEFDALHDVAHERGLFNVVVRTFVVIGLAYSVLPFLFPRALAGLLRTQPWETEVVGFMAGISMLALALRAIGQGIHHYKLYSFSIVAEGLGRVIGLLGFAMLGISIAKAAWGFLAGLFLGLLVMLIPLARRYARVAESPVHLDWARIAQTTTGAAALAIAMSFMGYLDVVIVKHFFDASEAGLYAAASLVGKILLYAVSFVPAVLIPQATNRHARGERTRGVMFASFGFVAASVICGIAIYAVFGRLLLLVFVGPKFSEAGPLLAVYAVAMAALAITNTIASYAIATHRLAFVLPLLLTTFATIVAMIVLHSTTMLVAVDMAVGNVVMLLATATALVAQGLHRAAVSSRTS